MPDNAYCAGEKYQEWRKFSQKYIDARSQSYIREIFSHLESKPCTAIEIGCATGETIGQLSKIGIRCWGVDTSERAVASARQRFPGVAFSVGAFPSITETIDLALLLHVIEHVADPVSLLRYVRGLISKNGWLHMRFPNFSGLPARVLGAAWPDFMRDHLHYFSKESIHYAFRKAGWMATHLSTRSKAWPWLGGVKRCLSGARPALKVKAHSPPDRGQLSILSMVDKLAFPFLRLEERTGLGNEWFVIARPE